MCWIDFVSIPFCFQGNSEESVPFFTLYTLRVKFKGKLFFSSWNKLWKSDVYSLRVNIIFMGAMRTL